MKKLFIPIALLLMLVVGCKHSPKNNEVEVETYTLSDSLYMENEYEEGYSHYTANIDLPVTNNDTLRLNILHWMLSPETEDYKSYFENDKDQFFSEEGSEPRSVIESNYTLSEQNDRYVTYISEGYIYTGGAHDVPWYYGATFSKKDGSLVGYDMFNDLEQLTEIVARISRSCISTVWNWSKRWKTWATKTSSCPSTTPGLRPTASCSATRPSKSHPIRRVCHCVKSPKQTSCPI